MENTHKAQLCGCFVHTALQRLVQKCLIVPFLIRKQEKYLFSFVAYRKNVYLCGLFRVRDYVHEKFSVKTLTTL